MHIRGFVFFMFQVVGSADRCVTMEKNVWMVSRINTLIVSLRPTLIPP